jgi:hypothetical protein
MDCDECFVLVGGPSEENWSPCGPWRSGLSVDSGVLFALRRNLKIANWFGWMFIERVAGGFFVETDLGL